MKIGLCTTSINVPCVLKQYAHAFYPWSRGGIDASRQGKIFVAADEQTPNEAWALVEECKGFCTTAGTQHWKHADLIGFRTDSRRNIAVLEALKWGADIVVSVDDDMINLSPDFFRCVERILTEPFFGVCLGRGDSTSWLDVGSLTIPPARQRGLPSNAGPPTTHEFVNDVQIGAMQGIILGTPDTDAATTIVNRPLVHSASDVLKSGFVVDPSTKAVFNSQITAFRRELAPAFAQFYKWQGRNTDIIASVLMRRVMRDRSLYTYFGPPTGYHARAPREPQKDMNAEQWGLNKIGPLQDYLERTNIWDNVQAEATCAQRLRAMYEDMLTFDMFPRENVKCALAWLDDCEKVL